ncbi:MAG: hypothetical protein Q8K68_06885 [Nitrospirota bacterium]|nr:hypothetical protein [Nitrospirota bacterium]
MTDTMKPSLSYTIICDDVRQEEGGKISLMGLFENIYALSFPVLQPRLALMSEWENGRGDFEMMTRLLTPDRKTTLRETVSRITVNDTYRKHRDVSVHINIEFPAPGTYWIEHSIDGELVSSIPLVVIQVKEQAFH